jgi:hypothetical protein
MRSREEKPSAVTMSDLVQCGGIWKTPSLKRIPIVTNCTLTPLAAAFANEESAVALSVGAPSVIIRRTSVAFFRPCDSNICRAFSTATPILVLIPRADASSNGFAIVFLEYGALSATYS